jgi:hypothetical protein
MRDGHSGTVPVVLGTAPRGPKPTIRLPGTVLPAPRHVISLCSSGGPWGRPARDPFHILADMTACNLARTSSSRWKYSGSPSFWILWRTMDHSPKERSSWYTLCPAVVKALSELPCLWPLLARVVLRAFALVLEQVVEAHMIGYPIPSRIRCGETASASFYGLCRLDRCRLRFNDPALLLCPVPFMAVKYSPPWRTSGSDPLRCPKLFPM